MIKAIIFDCFGVLLGNAYQMRLNEVEKVDPERAKKIRAINHASDMGIMSHEDITSQISSLFGISPVQFHAEQAQVEVPNTELLNYIQEIKKDFKTAMLSNVNSRERLDIRFTDGQLETCFDAVVASGDEGYVKPQVEIYQIAAMRLGVLPEECVMVDDMALFCEGARLAGMQAIQYKNNDQCINDLKALIDRGEKRD